MLLIGLLEEVEGHAEKAQEWIGSITKIEHRFVSTFSHLYATGCRELMSQTTEEDDYILLMRANSRVKESISEDWLALMIKAIDSDESIGAIAPRSTSAQIHQQPGPDFTIEDEVELTFQIVFPVIIIKRQAIQECGIFDERYIHYFADMDYSRELQSAGWKLGIYNGIIIEQDEELNAEIDVEELASHEVPDDQEKYNEKWNLGVDSLDMVAKEYDELRPVMYPDTPDIVATTELGTGIYIVFGEIIKANGKIIKIA